MSFLARCLLACTLTPAAAALPPALPPPAQEIFNTSIALASQSFDPAAHLLLRPDTSHATGKYLIRESSWYALALLMRDQPSDRATAAAILETVLAAQYTDPAARWFGTFKRTPEEPTPPANAIAFTQYDPNWRHFIGTTFQLILSRYPDRIPPALIPRLYASIDLSIAGEIHDGRLTENYSNIALMYGALWDFAATHNHNSQWLTQSATWNRTVFTLFRRHNTFAEFNSPTYYGVDLYGLALWRTLGSTPAMRRMGSTMESALWRDIADFYNPTLRNIAGPYDRSYGMDMQSYVSVTGVWLRSVLPAPQAPLPETLTPHTDHVADIYFAPQIALLGARIPPAALHTFTRPTPIPHLVHRPIDYQRTATAFIGPTAIWGGESTSLTRGVDAESQFHPATAQWLTPAKTGAPSVAWFSITRTPPIDAVATATGLTLTTLPGDVTIRIAIGTTLPTTINATTWHLPGMTVHIQGDTQSFTTTPATLITGLPALDVTYHHATHLTLALAPAP